MSLPWMIKDEISEFMILYERAEWKAADNVFQLKRDAARLLFFFFKAHRRFYWLLCFLSWNEKRRWCGYVKRNHIYHEVILYFGGSGHSARMKSKDNRSGEFACNNVMYFSSGHFEILSLYRALLSLLKIMVTVWALASHWHGCKSWLINAGTAAYFTLNCLSFISCDAE